MHTCIHACMHMYMYTYVWIIFLRLHLVVASHSATKTDRNMSIVQQDFMTLVFPPSRHWPRKPLKVVAGTMLIFNGICDKLDGNVTITVRFFG